ncbi:Levanase [Pseudolycoriella hygida]|uniref:Levanase n=1 Tax=Pseudolycoriella hygida TaxID=35572 RepID=A0A9Q0MT66_9DIPT|nr:Levanase [Pseudolycoriella hygida]
MSFNVRVRVVFYFISCLLVQSITSLCLTDQHRPQFHFSPAKYWINDPNGLIYVEGEYHMFYQFYPNGTTHGPMYWGHAISTDLIHWEELPIALSPDGLGEIYSGSAVLDVGNTSGLQTGSNPPIIAIFTQASDTQVQSIAVSNDKGRTFEKYASNPVLPSPGVKDFRDPKVFEMNGKWIMSLAVNDSIHFYSSNNLKSWTALSKFGSNPLEGAHGGVWECPDLLDFDFNGHKVWVLLVSINPGGPNLGSVTQYFLGDFDGETFRKFGIGHDLWMDWGPDNYAGVSFSNDPKNRKLLIAWLNNWLYGEVIPTEEWRGQMTIPRVLELTRVDNKVRLASAPAEEMELLRISSQFYEKLDALTINSGSVYTLSDDFTFSNPLLEVDVVLNITLGTADKTATFQFCFFNSLNEELCVGYSYDQNYIYLDRAKAGAVNFHPDFGKRAMATRDTKSKIIEMKLYLDTSIIELFADKGVTVMTAMFFPTEPFTQLKVAFSSANSSNQLTVSSFTVRGLKSIYDC